MSLSALYVDGRHKCSLYQYSHPMSENLSDLYQAIILDHNKRPRHYGALAEATHRAEGYNPLCGDKIEVFLQLSGDQIEAIQFECASCAICKASASIMAEALVGQSLPVGDSIQESVNRVLKTDTEMVTLDAQVRSQRFLGYEIFLHGLSVRPCLGTPIKRRYAAKLRL